MPTHPIRALLLLSLVVALGACSAGGGTPGSAEREQAAAAAPQAAQPAAASPPDGNAAAPAPACDASRVQGLVGQAADEAKAEQARLDAGADRVRLLKPGQMVTMEFDDARLSVEIDDSGTITALRCG